MTTCSSSFFSEGWSASSARRADAVDKFRLGAWLAYARAKLEEVSSDLMDEASGLNRGWSIFRWVRRRGCSGSSSWASFDVLGSIGPGSHQCRQRPVPSNRVRGWTSEDEWARLGSSEVTCGYRCAAELMGFEVVSTKLENSKVRRCDAGVRR